MSFLDHLPDQVSIYEVGPRDGLQNESASVGIARKARLIEALVGSGLKRVEITSFVSPKWIPQLADADDLALAIERENGVSYSALVPNLRGLERATAAKMTDIAVFLSASETHNRRNINKSIASTMDAFRDLIPAARQRGMRVRAYVSTVWGCPYEGNVDTRRVVDLSRALLDMGCFEISLGDTLGIGTPLQTRRILAEVLSDIPASALAMHMHDTRGMALTNVTVGLEMGIRAFDTAIAGMGGCPYAPGASGNLATEDLIYMLHSLGIKTGVDLPKLMEAGQVAEAIVRRELPGRVHRAGLRSLNR